MELINKKKLSFVVIESVWEEINLISECIIFYYCEFLVFFEQTLTVSKILN